MTRLIQSLRCSLNNKQTLKGYYNSLGKDELIAKKKNIRKIYLVPTIAWITSFYLIMYSAKMSLPVLILYSGTTVGIIINLYIDYKNRKKIIEKTLEKFDN